MNNNFTYYLPPLTNLTLKDTYIKKIQNLQNKLTIFDMYVLGKTTICKLPFNLKVLNFECRSLHIKKFPENMDEIDLKISGNNYRKINFPKQIKLLKIEVTKGAAQFISKSEIYKNINESKVKLLQIPKSLTGPKIKNRNNISKIEKI